MIYFNYNDGKAECIIRNKNNVFVGEAYCHPKDDDFKSERVGLCIAEARAYIKQLCHKRDNILLPQLQILNHLYDNISRSKNFEPKSYEAKMIRSQIKAIEKNLATINTEIQDERHFLKEYIDGKENFYQRIRAKNQ